MWCSQTQADGRISNALLAAHECLRIEVAYVDPTEMKQVVVIQRLLQAPFGRSFAAVRPNSTSCERARTPKPTASRAERLNLNLNLSHGFLKKEPLGLPSSRDQCWPVAQSIPWSELRPSSISRLLASSSSFSSLQQTPASAIHYQHPAFSQLFIASIQLQLHQYKFTNRSRCIRSPRSSSPQRCCQVSSSALHLCMHAFMQDHG